MTQVWNLEYSAEYLNAGNFKSCFLFLGHQLDSYVTSEAECQPSFWNTEVWKAKIRVRILETF